MARRRRGEQNEGEPSQPAGEGPQDAGPQIEVKMKGGADDVRRQLGVRVEEKPAAEKPVVNGHDDEKKKFVEALRNPKYIIRVKRVTPREFNGVKTNVQVWDTELPLSYQEIQEEVGKAYLGGKYRVAIVNPSTNDVVAADTFEVDGDPKVQEAELSQEEQDRIFLQGQPKTASDLTEEGLDRRARVSAKMLEVEALEAQLVEARDRRKLPDRVAVQDDTRIEALERNLVEAKHQAELEARDRKHQEEMKELRALITQNAAPKKTENDSAIMMMLEQMREDRKQNAQMFTQVLTQMKDEKLNAVLEEVKAIKNKPNQQSNSLLDQAEAILKLKKVFGWGDDGDEGDDENDVDDKRPWWERALDKLGGRFGDKLLAKFTDMEEKGEVVDREKFIKEMSGYADQIAAEAVSRQLPTSGTRPGLPAPAAPVQKLPPPPSAVPGSVSELPPPPPASAPPAPPPPAPATAPTLTLEQEIAVRVATTLELLSWEAVLRPNEYTWNYEGCWSSLPEDILEKVCASVDVSAMIDALVIPGMDPAKVNEFKQKIVSNPRALAWVTRGLDELKKWWAEKQKDPAYDPFADEDDGGEEAGD